MEKNKKIIVSVVFVISLSFLGWFIYKSFYSSEEEDNSKAKIQFEIPEVSKEEEEVSKIEYYNTQIKSKGGAKKLNINNGFKNDSLKFEFQEDINMTYDEKKNIKADYGEGLQSDSVNEESIESILEQEVEKKAPSKEIDIQDEETLQLNRLLDIMESNSEHMNNMEKEMLMSKNVTLQEEGINEDRIAEIIESIPEQNEDISISENIDYKKDFEEKETNTVFFGITKNKESFKGAVSDVKAFKKELYRAEFYMTQLVENGGLIMINLLEDVFFTEGLVIPKNTVLYGTARFSPNRLFLKISPNILENKRRLPNPITIYDFDGLEGIFIEINSLPSIPVETAEELTELIKQSYKNANPIIGNTNTVPLKEASIIIGSEKVLKYLNRSKLKVFGGHKLWLSVSENQ